MQTINITAHTEDDSQIEAIKAVINPEFVKKIQQGDEDLQNGKGTKMTIEELERLYK